MCLYKQKFHNIRNISMRNKDLLSQGDEVRMRNVNVVEDHKNSSCCFIKESERVLRHMLKKGKSESGMVWQ